MCPYHIHGSISKFICPFSNLCIHFYSCFHFRIVYRWFLTIYQVSYVLGILGYIVLLVVFSGLGLLLPANPDVILEFGVVLIFYGVYYGVMGRDCAEVCVDYMAAAMTVWSTCNYDCMEYM